MKKNDFMAFSWRVTAGHTIAYFIAGIFAFIFMGYKEQFAGETLSLIMKPVDSPWVAAGPALQVIRGLILATILYPFKGIFLETKMGWLKLWWLVFGLSFISTIGPTFGSFEGFIYTKLPLQYHLLGIPETLLYTFAFSFFIFFWYKSPKRIWNILSVVLMIIILVMSMLGVLSSSGVLK